MENNATIELTMILVPDHKTGQFSAFFAQFPEAIAVGETQEAAQSRLIALFSTMMSDREAVMSESIPNAEFIRKPANLVFA